MDLHTLERLGHERQHALLSEAASIRRARRLARPSPLRLRLAYWLRLWAAYLDRQGATEPAPETAIGPGC